MTAYFDSIVTQLRDASRAGKSGWSEEVRALEERMVFDCTVASMLPGFPVDLRMQIHHVVLKFGVVTQPVNRPAIEYDFETDEQHFRRLFNLEWYLHSIFHELAHLRGGGWDSPTLGVRIIAENGEEERERLYEWRAAERAKQEKA